MVDAIDLIVNSAGVGGICWIIWKLACLSEFADAIRDRVGALEEWRRRFH